MSPSPLFFFLSTVCKSVDLGDELLYADAFTRINKVVLSGSEFQNKGPPLFSPGVVPKPTSQVASAGEARGELHQAPGHLLLPALLQLLSLQLPGL